MTIEELKFDEAGLVPVITQDVDTKQVLMLAYANKEAMEKTLQTGRVHYYSRSRQCLWLKGETSGHFQFVKYIMYDCDQDAVLIQVKQEGAACHTGEYSCFYRPLEGEMPVEEAEFRVLQELYETIIHRRDHIRPGSYTCYLFEKGIDKMLKKVGEEAAEVIIASKNPDNEELRYEIADLFYHVMVVMVERGLTLQEIMAELKKRRK